MESVKLTRKFPKKWGYINGRAREYVNGLAMFYVYCTNLREDMCGIERHDQKSFDAKNFFAIREYKMLFDKYLKEFNNIVLKKEKLDYFNKNAGKEKTKELLIELNENLEEYINYEKFNTNKKFKTFGVKNEYYDEINEAAKKIFLLEKYCSSTTKQIWNEQLTKFKKFDQYEAYNIIIKIVFPNSWRQELFISKKIKKFVQQRKYQSASLMNDRSMFCLFNYYNRRTSALLIYEPDASKIVCANKIDAFSDEYINKKNPYYEKTPKLDIKLIEKTNIDGKLHELYANATEIATPNCLLYNEGTYNEVVVRNPKVIGVLAPNKESEKFAQEVAKSQDVEYYGILEKIEMYNYADEFLC